MPAKLYVRTVDLKCRAGAPCIALNALDASDIWVKVDPSCLDHIYGGGQNPGPSPVFSFLKCAHLEQYGKLLIDVHGPWFAIHPGWPATSNVLSPVIHVCPGPFMHALNHS